MRFSNYLGVGRRFQVCIIVFLIFLSSITFMSVYVKGDPGPAAILRLSLPAGTYQSPSSDPWLNEVYLLNVTDSPGTFTLRINDTSASITSYDSHLIIALNNASYNSLLSLSVNSTAILKTDFTYGTPNPYNVWTWPSGDVYPTWFADTYIFGILYQKSNKALSISVTLSNATGARMHFDAYGSEVTPPPPSNPGELTHNPISGDSTVQFDGKLSSTTVTLLSDTNIPLGGSVTDTATVTGTGPTPTGTVTFYVGTSVTGPWTQVGGVKTLDGAGQAFSDSYTPPAAGTYYFYVSYSGDSNYLPSESAPAREVVDVVIGGFTKTIDVVPASIDYNTFVIGLVALIAPAAAYTALRLRRRSRRKPFSHS